MTDDDKALVERLREGVLYGDARLHNPKGHDPLRMEAADRIEALSAANERLRELLVRWQGTGCPDCSGDCGAANPPVMCCIMEETRAALGDTE